MLIMQPVMTDIYRQGWEPLESGKVSWEKAFDDGSKPLKSFLVKFVREKDVRLFLEVSHTPAPQRPADLGLTVLVPAYVLSELKTGFQIGAVLFLPLYARSNDTEDSV